MYNRCKYTKIKKTSYMERSIWQALKASVKAPDDAIFLWKTVDDSRSPHRSARTFARVHVYLQRQRPRRRVHAHLITHRWFSRGEIQRYLALTKGARSIAEGTARASITVAPIRRDAFVTKARQTTTS